MSYEEESLRLILILSSNDFNCLPNLNLFRHIGFTIYPMRKMSLYIKWFNRIDCNAWCIPKKKKSIQPKIAILTVSLFRTQFKIQQYSKWLLRSTVWQAENEVGTFLVIQKIKINVSAEQRTFQLATHDVTVFQMVNTRRNILITNTHLFVWLIAIILPGIEKLTGTLAS